MALIVSAHPAAAGSVSPEPLQFAQVFNDLPGVTTQEQAEEAKRLKCEQVLVKRHVTSLDPVYDTVNSCRRGDGPAFRSMRLPRRSNASCADSITKCPTIDGQTTDRATGRLANRNMINTTFWHEECRAFCLARETTSCLKRNGRSPSAHRNRARST